MAALTLEKVNDIDWLSIRTGRVSSIKS